MPGAVRCNALEWRVLCTHHRGMKLTLTLTALFAAFAVHAAAQSAPPPGQKLTLASQAIGGYTAIQRDLLEAAQLMPEADYLFKPTPETRPFAQLISHVALTQFRTCSLLQGGQNPKAAEKEETPRSKAVLIALLKESATFCNPLVNAMTEEGMVQLMKVGPNEVARGGAVIGLSVHGNEVYGTIAVYLRLKGIVPPTTAREKPVPTK
jgi:DinB family protein